MERFRSFVRDSQASYDSSFMDFEFDSFDCSIILPPPNVTGNLHIGHALNIFIQDLMVRTKAFDGIKVMWIPGTDHAGISMQSVVQSKLDGVKDLSNDDFLSKIWHWKSFFEDKICSQIRNLKCLVAWGRYKFTLEEEMKERVSEAFCRLYEDGLIFKDKRIINWDTKLQTAISDIEVVEKKSSGFLWYLRYDLENGGFIEVATTRPETIFADEAVLVNPKDERYVNLIGKRVFVPITRKLVPIVSDSRCEIEKGSGALKIDPAHAVLDFEIGKKYSLNMKQVIDKHGKMCGDAPSSVLGLDILKARKVIVEMLKEKGFLQKEEKIENFLPYGSKSDTLIEPMLSDQWFLDLPKLSGNLLQLIDEKKIQFIPDFFENLYRHYAQNLQPWCISRQIIWGHRIPIWNSSDGKFCAAKSFDEAVAKIGPSATQDSDVLDTWFSSALWPMTTLGWPDQMDPKFYPNEFLVTGRDILLFWVTKMMVMHVALVDKNSAPFKKVYLHGLIQDDSGLKMSKSKGNVMDPLEISSHEGVDVLRFALLYSSISGRDIKFGRPNVDHARKFLIKVYNAMNFCLDNKGSVVDVVENQVNIWILSEIESLEKSLSICVDEFKIRELTLRIYDFFWNEFCDWYLESAKYLFSTKYESETRGVILICINRLLRIMHPVLPCATEYFWLKFGNQPNIIKNYKRLASNYEPNDSFLLVKSIVSSIRSICSSLSLPKNLQLFISFRGLDVDMDLIRTLSKYNNISLEDKSASGEFLSFSFSGVVLFVPLVSGPVDIKNMVFKIIKSINSEIALLENKLKDNGFLKNANQDEVVKMKNRLMALKLDLSMYMSA